MRKALCYLRHRDGSVQCLLCAHKCIIFQGKRGLCGVRENRNQTLWSLVYDRPVVLHVDPIEEKSLYHVCPGSLSYSYGTAGCNFKCTFCKNTEIAHPQRVIGSALAQDFSPEEIVSQALQVGCSSIVASYTEPTVFMEYALEVARLGRQSGLVQVFDTNGFMTLRAIENLLPVLDAANVDLKSFRNKFYVQKCAGGLQPVLQTLQALKQNGIWLEISTLILPGLNDDPIELKDMAEFIASLGVETPWHICAFQPGSQMLNSFSKVAKRLYKFKEIGLAAGLRYVYLDNLLREDSRDTYCHNCGQKLIDRSELVAKPVGLNSGSCISCLQTLPGIGMFSGSDLPVNSAK